MNTGIRIIWSILGFFIVVVICVLSLLVVPFLMFVAFFRDEGAENFRELGQHIFENGEQERQRKIDECPLKYSHSVYGKDIGDTPCKG